MNTNIEPRMWEVSISHYFEQATHHPHCRMQSNWLGHGLLMGVYCMKEL